MNFGVGFEKVNVWLVLPCARGKGLKSGELVRVAGTQKVEAQSHIQLEKHERLHTGHETPSLRKKTDKLEAILKLKGHTIQGKQDGREELAVPTEQSMSGNKTSINWLLGTHP
jgi:hypothetical protein